MRQDETRAQGSTASSPIPTFGAATTAIDQYRTVGIYETNLQELNVALTDVNAVIAISKVAEGGLSDVGEIEAAETALQALLLHDIVHVVVCGPKIELENGLVTYLRTDDGMRTDFGFELFQLASSRDWIISPEYAAVKGGRVFASSLEKSPSVAHAVEELRLRQVPYWNADIAEAVNATIQEHGIPAYLSDPWLLRTRKGDGFPKRFYHRMRVSWDQAVGDLPPIVCTFALPPLLAIVLDRLNNRAELKSEIVALREELTEVRLELHQLNELVTHSASQAEIDARIRHIDASFDAIVPESRLSGSARRQRRLVSVHRLVRPIVRFMAALHQGIGYGDMVDIAGDMNKIFESRSVVDRTTTARAFSGLLREVEALQSLVKHHLTEFEVNAIENSRLRPNTVPWV